MPIQWPEGKRPVFVGAGWTMIRRYMPRTKASNAKEAATMAIADAGLKGSDIDGIPQASQKPAFGYREPMITGAPGHGEGHNSGQAVNIAAALEITRTLLPQAIELREELNVASSCGRCACCARDVLRATLKEIGDKYNLSRERIRQLQEQALGKIRKHMRD